MLTLIKHARLFAPDDKGICHLLLAGNRIWKILRDQDDLSAWSSVPVIDASGRWLTPGFVDGLVHFCGGGGEGGYHNRTMELDPQEAVRSGVTSMIGALGTDSITRSLANLLGKARELASHGLNTWFYSGSYHYPATTLTGSVQTDLLYIPEIIGVGEVALADNRGSYITPRQLINLAAETRLGALLAGKKGVVFCHIGAGSDQLDVIRQAVAESDFHLSYFVPTHMNRNLDLLQTGFAFVRDGGYIDFTTSSTPELIAEGDIPAEKALALALEAGVAADRLTFSSDANASLPLFNEQGDCIGVTPGRLISQFNSMVAAIRDYQVAPEVALGCITRNPAKALGLAGKGVIVEGGDADMVLIDPDNWQIDQVWSAGQSLYQRC